MKEESTSESKKKVWPKGLRLKRRWQTPSKDPSYESLLEPHYEEDCDDEAESSTDTASPHHSLDLTEPPSPTLSLRVAQRLEACLRQVCLLLGAYLLGVHQAQFSFVGAKCLEYGLVAWITCAVLIWASDKQQERRRFRQQQSQQSEEQIPLLLSHHSKSKPQGDLEANENDPSLSEHELTYPTFDESPMSHPSLEPFFCIHTESGQRVIPNGPPFLLDTEYFTGHMMVLIRTPNVDDKNETPSAFTDFFSTKQRRFEFQFQVKVKKIPTGRVVFACENTEPVKMGIIQRAFVSTCMAFVKSTNNNFHYSIAGTSEDENGNAERPHMAFPVEQGLNRVVITPPGETPPELGTDIYESCESIKARKKGGPIEWNLTDTFTMSLWSAYMDFLQWRVLNLPGIKPFSLTNIFGRQPVYLTLYEHPEDLDVHYKKDITQIVELELSHAVTCAMGPNAQAWAELRQGRPMNHDMDHDPSTNFVAEDAVAELGEGIYVRTGDSITLQEMNDETSSCFVTYAGGFCVLQEESSSNIIIEKVGRRQLTRKQSGLLALSKQSPLIKSGDTVMFKLVTKGRNNKAVSRYLTTHKGWWLKWDAGAPTKNACFTIYTHETEQFENEHGVRSETQSAYLTLGGSFWLSHKRFRHYRIGAAPDSSVTYGGRMLGLYYAKGTAEDNDDYVLDQPDDGYHNSEPDPPDEKSKSDWLLPLQLRAYEPFAENKTLFTNEVSLDIMAIEDKKIEPLVGKRMDVPAWLEMMNRADRTRQLLYVVRVSPEELSEHIGEEKTEAFIRLRTGRELSQVTRVPRSGGAPGPGQEKGKDLSLSPVKQQRSLSPSMARDMAFQFNTSHSHRSFDTDGSLSAKDDDSSEEGEWNSSDDLGDTGVVDEVLEAPSMDTSKNHRRAASRKFIGKIGKTVVRQSVKVGKGSVKVTKGTLNVGKKTVKGTVKAGKAILTPPVNAGKSYVYRGPKKPPKEPSAKASKRKGTRKENEKELHVAVLGKRDVSIGSPVFLAGQLSAPEQSCRTVSSMLSDLSANRSDLLASQVQRINDHDKWFLTGSAIHIGVAAPSKDVAAGSLLHDCLVARCLWESHW
jgi:hypothetical protein